MRIESFLHTGSGAGFAEKLRPLTANALDALLLFSRRQHFLVKRLEQRPGQFTWLQKVLDAPAPAARAEVGLGDDNREVLLKFAAALK